jgi:formylglycine-generating enzyme required for sulfatase activity
MGRITTHYQDSIEVNPRAKMDDKPANNIYLDAFYMDKYEVTNAEYARFLQATGTKPPWHWPQGKIEPGEERFPASNVNWYEADAYCKSVGKRLPTEAEWEKAVRDGHDRANYPWGDAYRDGREQNKLAQTSGVLPGAPPVQGHLGTYKPTNVGSFKPNNYGVYDLTGNVTEWTNDWYDYGYYLFMPKRNPQGPETGLYKSIRGPSYSDGRGGQLVMTFFRNFTDPELRALTIGFRCAKSVQ